MGYVLNREPSPTGNQAAVLAPFEKNKTTAEASYFALPTGQNKKLQLLFPEGSPPFLKSGTCSPSFLLCVEPNRRSWVRG